MIKKPFTSDEIKRLHEIVDRKKKGQDCTEEESAFIKQYFKNEDGNNHFYIGVTLAFPQEFDEASNEMDIYTNYPHLYEKISVGEEKETKTTNQLISDITEVLSQWDGKDLEHIANQILSNPVKYIGDSMFEAE